MVFFDYIDYYSRKRYDGNKYNLNKHSHYLAIWEFNLILAKGCAS